MTQTGALGFRLAHPLVQRLRAMEGEQAARAGFGVPQVSEEGFLACAFVMVDQELVPLGQMVGQAQCVFLRLVGNPAQGHAGLLGLDDPGRLAPDKKQIVAEPGRQRELANGNAQRRVAVEGVAIVRDPSGLSQQPVYLLTRNFFRAFQINTFLSQTKLSDRGQCANGAPERADPLTNPVISIILEIWNHH